MKAECAVCGKLFDKVGRTISCSPECAKKRKMQWFSKKQKDPNYVRARKEYQAQLREKHGYTLVNIDKECTADIKELIKRIGKMPRNEAIKQAVKIALSATSPP